MSRKTPSPLKLSVCPKTFPGFPRSSVTQIAIPSPCKCPRPCILNSTSIWDRLQLIDMCEEACRTNHPVRSRDRHTREEPSRLALHIRSETYVPVIQSFRPRLRILTDCSVLTGLLVRWCLLQTRSIDFAYQSQDMAVEVPVSNMSICIHRICLSSGDAPSKDD